MVGCGGGERSEPSQADVARVSAAIDDIVVQCRMASAGFVEGVDTRTLQGHVDTLVRTYERVRPDAPILIEGLPGETRRTTMRERLRFALRRLDGCSPPLAASVRDALGAS